ncbi:MAG: response regulator transcription factor [Flavobacteriales bacterium]|jgi:two-component system alkaline phosphatase synthesis response regulator PhoP|nr:response regulator transcription factor [Flavobacteriales bacterium]
MSNSKYKILVVDDDPDIIEIISYNLEKEGFQVATANNGKGAIDMVKKDKPHLIILDVMMPGMDGVETCETLRSSSKNDNIIIAFLTARGEDYSQIAGFDAGADDYITKPIKPKVLISRIKALLRRKGSIQQEDNSLIIDIKDLKIDREQYLVFKGSKQIELPRKEFELLLLMASKPGKVFNREEIFSNIWGHDVVVGGRTIDVHIRKLREKIGDGYIKTIKGIGYKFDI